MKLFGLTIDARFIGQVLLSTLIGGLIGFGVEVWRENHLAIFICAVATGTSTIWRLRRQQLNRET